MSYSIDDTQPGAPFQGEPVNLKPTLFPENDRPARGGSCLLNVLIVGMLLAVAVAIVALSGAAGWTAGQREANTNATATQNSAINDQLQRLPGDIANGNDILVQARLNWLATQTPGVPGVGDFMMTATAHHESSLPTATPQASPTPEATLGSEATDALALTPEASGGYDLASILNQAQSAASSSQWQNAIDLLNVILASDPSFETNTVRALMLQALSSDALELYNAKKPAEANFLVDQAEQYGTLPEGLSYERYAAGLYLKARSEAATGSPAAISDLQALISQGAGGRYYSDAQQLLYNYYVASGDAYVAQSDNCSAAGQYQNAANVLPSGIANGKYAAAQNACQNAPPTVDPNLVIPSDGSVAPVGVVATPG